MALLGRERAAVLAERRNWVAAVYPVMETSE